MRTCAARATRLDLHEATTRGRARVTARGEHVAPGAGGCPTRTRHAASWNVLAWPVGRTVHRGALVRLDAEHVRRERRSPLVDDLALDPAAARQTKRVASAGRESDEFAGKNSAWRASA